jgi:hypothetical protein
MHQPFAATIDIKLKTIYGLAVQIRSQHTEPDSRAKTLYRPPQIRKLQISTDLKELEIKAVHQQSL